MVGQLPYVPQHVDLYFTLHKVQGIIAIWGPIAQH